MPGVTAVSDLLIAISSIVSAFGGLVAHQGGSVRARFGHVLACTAMIAMAVPRFDLLHPLLWFLLLGAAAFWIAGSKEPVLTRLPVLQDLFVMACLMIVMPLTVSGPAVRVRSGHHAAHAIGSAGAYWVASAAVVALWVAGRVVLWMSVRRKTGSGSLRGPAVLAEAGMVTAMALMVL